MGRNKIEIIVFWKELNFYSYIVVKIVYIEEFVGLFFIVLYS